MSEKRSSAPVTCSAHGRAIQDRAAGKSASSSLTERLYVTGGLSRLLRGFAPDHLAKGDVFPGQSGGPMFGFWTGDVGPRAVAVQSWHNSSTNGASDGDDLVDLVIRARSDHP